MDEMDALILRQTWDRVPTSSGLHIVGCRQVFTIKYRSDGTVTKYKARLVICGFTQTYGVDYIKTFPMARLNFIRILFALVINHQWSMFQLDVKNSFLYGDLEEVYMKQPPEFVAQGENIVYKLKKVIYCPKRSPQA